MKLEKMQATLILELVPAMASLGEDMVNIAITQ